MTNYQTGDLVLVAFPDSTGLPGKRRPALVIADTGDSDAVPARVTTQIHKSPFDVQIQDWQTAGLLVPSVVRLHKLATLEKRLVARRLGVVSNADRILIKPVLESLAKNW